MIPFTQTPSFDVQHFSYGPIAYPLYLLYRPLPLSRLRHCCGRCCYVIPCGPGPLQYQANAATLISFSKEGTILIKKNLYEYKGYNARQFITEFPDKGWMKNGEVKKVRNSRRVNNAE